MGPVLASQEDLSQAVQRPREAKLQDFSNCKVDSSTGGGSAKIERSAIQSFSTAGHPLWRSYSAYVAPNLRTWQTIADQNRP